MVKITAGFLKGKKLQVAKGNDVRPSKSLVREAIFNIIQNYCQISEIIVIDLFAGSGALGIEAISRGANKVYLIDSSKKIISVLNKNIKTCKLNENVANVVNSNALNWIKNISFISKPSLVFVDPPFKKNLYEPILIQLAHNKYILKGSLIIV